jgi:hypothetical protein
MDYQTVLAFARRESMENSFIWGLSSLMGDTPHLKLSDSDRSFLQVLSQIDNRGIT